VAVSLLGTLAACHSRPAGPAETQAAGTAAPPASTHAPGPAPVPAVSRPPYNTGKGFFVYAGKLYDPSGHEFRIRGVNRVHFDSPSQPGISGSKANAVRLLMYKLSFGAASYVRVLQTQHVDYGEVPIPAMALFPDDAKTSCNTSQSELSAGVAWWAANVRAFARLDSSMILNIANEWGPANSPAWRDAYIAAVGTLREAGYRSPLLIDAGGCGQDAEEILQYALAVYASDPQKNVMFSYHDYSPVSSLDYFPQLAQLASQGVVVIVGEFGPGRNIGPSPTVLTPRQVITAAEASGLGWLAWAWDDNNLANGASDDGWFSMTYAGPGIYVGPADLTQYGKEIVLNPSYGLKALAKPANLK
jgi:mannan endo-1,4-beta-mannosidase